jgi:HSP20 family molecular chaperone IbpA
VLRTAIIDRICKEWRIENMAERTVAAPETVEGTRHRERYTTPAVDIYETPDGLVVKADLPGVSRDDLDVHVDNNTLTIKGIARHAAPGDAVYREYELVNFFRQFELGDKVDQTRIAAEVNNGVLTLTLPKPEEAKARQIEVTVA